MQMNKATEPNVDDSVPVDAPPSYTPHPTPRGGPIDPSPSTSTSLPTPQTAIPERIYAPSAPFSVDLTKIGPEPTNVICPRCQFGVTTNTRSRAGTHAGVWAAICCLSCGVIAAILPLVIPSCQDVEHTCPHCGFLMARYRRGVDNAKVYPVINDQGYIPVAQDDESAPLQGEIAKPSMK